jgi:hypothetical protein
MRSALDITAFTSELALELGWTRTRSVIERSSGAEASR